MTALYIILGILAALFLLSLLRLGVRIELGEQIGVTVVAGPLRLRLLPKPDKPQKEKKPKKQKIPREKKPAETKEKKLTLTAEDIKTALPALWQSLKGGLRKTRQRLLFQPLELSAVLPGKDDPAGAAELYGYINAGMWTVMPQLEKLTRIPDPRLHVEVDFQGEKLRLTGQVGITLQIRDLLAVGIAFAGPLLRWLLAMKKRQKQAPQPHRNVNQASEGADDTKQDDHGDKVLNKGETDHGNE